MNKMGFMNWTAGNAIFSVLYELLTQKTFLTELKETSAAVTCVCVSVKIHLQDYFIGQTVAYSVCVLWFCESDGALYWFARKEKDLSLLEKKRI